MSNLFFERPILNSPYECPTRHWELDEHGQPTQKTLESRRRVEFITPIPRPKKRKAGPVRVSGSAGTGKTIVAVHRAVHLARAHPDARVLLTTFSDALANALRTKVRRLVGNEPRLAERIDVHSLPAIGLRLYKAHVGPVALADPTTVADMIAGAAKAVPGHKFGPAFLRSE